MAANGENDGTKEGENFTLKNLLDNMNKMATLEASQTPKHTQKVSQELKQTTFCYHSIALICKLFDFLCIIF